MAIRALRRAGSQISRLPRTGRARALPRSAASIRTRNRAGAPIAFTCCCSALRGSFSLTRSSGCSATCRSTRRASPACPRRSRSTRPSASSPTPTGKAMRANRPCRTSPRWRGSRCITSCPPRPASRIAFALIRGFARRETRDDRQFLGRPHPDHALYPAADQRRLRAGPRRAAAFRRRSPARSPRRRWKARKQVIALGRSRRRIAIKMLGTNGGGFFNANAAHPFENPSDLSQLHPDAVDLRARRGADLDVRQGGRQHQAGLGDPRGDDDPVHRRRGHRLRRRKRQATRSTMRWASMPARGNMEGKEVRFGIAASALFATVTTDASCGAVNAMHDSFTPLGGLVPLFNIQLGEIVIGGVGVGPLRLPAVRHPRDVRRRADGRADAGICRQEDREPRGEARGARNRRAAADRSWASPRSPRCCRMGLPGRSTRGRTAFARSSTPSPSATGNNGSAFAGLTASNTFLVAELGIAMFVGRFFMIMPMLAIAGSLAAKKSSRKAPAPSRPPAGCGSACSSASS